MSPDLPGAISNHPPVRQRPVTGGEGGPGLLSTSRARVYVCVRVSECVCVCVGLRGGGGGGGGLITITWVSVIQHQQRGVI